MASVMGLLEAREAAALVRVEGLRAEVDRVLAELADAEAVLERQAIALAELAEALAEPGPGLEEPVRPVPVVAKVPVAGSVVPTWREGLTVGPSPRTTRGCHQHRQQQAEAVHDDVPLAPVDQLAAVEAA